MFWCHLWQLLVCPEVAIFGNLMNVVTKLPKMATPGQATFGMSRCYHFWQLGGSIPPSCQKWQLLHMPKVANFCYVNAVAIFGNLMGVFQQVARNGNILTYILEPTSNQIWSLLAWSRSLPKLAMSCFDKMARFNFHCCLYRISTSSSHKYCQIWIFLVSC